MNGFPRFATVLAAALMAGSLSACMAAFGPGSDVTEVGVVVLHFDPHPDGHREPGLAELQGWTPAEALVDSLRYALWDRSFRKLLVRVVERRELDAFPAMGGGSYDAERYGRCLDDEAACIQGPMDLPAVLERYGVAALVDAEIVDEVWILGGPHMGIEGTHMVGTGPILDSNHPAAGGGRPFPVLGFRTDAGMGSVLHTYCRRVEAFVEYGLAATAAGTREWDRFTTTAADGEPVGVGRCDHAPNAPEPGVYSYPDTVVSTAPEWLSYPVAPGATQPVSAAVWNGPDYRRNFAMWWLFHLPHGDRPTESGVPSSWWPLVLR